MRRIAIAVLAAAVVTVPAVTAAAAPPADSCLDRTRFFANADPLATTDGTLRFSLVGTDCTDGGTITLTDPTGASHTAPFSVWNLGGVEGESWSSGGFPVPLATGAGIWRVTALSHGGATAVLSPAVPVTVLRASSIKLDADPFVVPPGNRAVITGVLGRHTSDGTVAPYGANLKVELLVRPLFHPYPEITVSGLTDANGRFRIAVAPAESSELQAYSGAVTPPAHAGGTVLMQRQVKLLSADPEPAQLTPTTTRAIAWPAGARMNLEQFDASDNRWVRVAYGNSTSTGSISVTDSPPALGSQRMRIAIYRTDDGAGVSQEFTRVVKFGTSLDGLTGATTATVIRPGTKMSTYGHLKIRKYGVTRGYVAVRVDIQTRPRGTTAAYRTVASATTTGTTGYYYANWNVSSDVDVRVQFLSPDTNVKHAWKYIRAVDVR